MTENVTRVATKGQGLEVYQNWDNDGCLVIRGAKTLGNYQKLAYDTHPNCTAHRCFYAFNKQQFEQGCSAIHWDIEKDGKLISAGSGLYGVKEGLDRYLTFYENLTKQIAQECDPEEAYYWEYNNYECCIDWDGDARAWEKVCQIFGEERCKGIKRLRWMN